MGMGVRQPFENVVEQHGKTVLRVCRVVLGAQDAEDAWSETFLAALRAYPGLPETANVEAWLVTIAHRKAIDVLRARKRQPAPAGELADAGRDLEAARRELLDLLTVGAGPSALFLADQDLTLQAMRYFSLLHPLVVEAEGEDLAALEAANNTMQSAARVIETSGYNESVGVFHRTVLGQFPMNFLREIVFVQMPELFA